MSNPAPERPTDYTLPFTGDGVNFSVRTQSGIAIRPIPLSAGILPRTTPWAYNHVFSPFCRLYFARHSSLFIQSEGATLRVPGNGFLLIPAAFNFHCAATDRNAQHLWIHFEIQPPYVSGFSQPIAIEGTQLSRAITRKLWRLLEQPSSLNSSIHLTKALLHLLFSDLNFAANTEIPPAIESAFQVMNAHLQRPLSVKDLARSVGYSPEHLAHLFRIHLKQSPSDFIRTARVQEAARRLAYTHDTIEAIADDLCFANRHHFSRVFKATLNHSPAAFRQQVRAQTRPSITDAKA